MSEIAGYELKIVGTGQCHDAEGNLLDSDGNIITEAKETEK